MKHASTPYWAEDRRECERVGMLWIPVVYPGFSWDNLQRQTPGTSLIARRGGEFLWEQFHELSRLGADTVYVAMFDEVDEGTAIFKVTSSPPPRGTSSATTACPATGICGSSARPLAGCATRSRSLARFRSGPDHLPVASGLDFSLQIVTGPNRPTQQEESPS